MPAVEAGYDLAAISLCVLALGLLLAVKGLTRGTLGAIEHIGALGFYPFRGIATTVESAIVRALDDAIKGVEKTTARFFSGLIDSLGILVGVTLIALILVKDAFSFLWHHGLPTLIRAYTDPLGTIARASEALVHALEGTVAGNVGRAERFAEAQAERAYSDVLAVVRPEIRAAENAATGYADEAVAKLRAAEDTAIGHALAVAVEAQAAGIAAAAHAATEAEGVAAAALASSEAAAREALAGVKAIAIDAGHELDVIAAGRDAAGLAALIASIPLLATFVHTLATDTGLENQECRSKVKGICSTDPNAWAGLLAGVVAVGAAFDFADVVRAAVVIEGEAAHLFRKLAAVTDADVEDAGRAIGAAARAIAA